MNRTVLITGGLGFIGSNLVKYWINKYPNDAVVVADAFTYAARPAFLVDHCNRHLPRDRHPQVIPVNIAEPRSLDALINNVEPDIVIHLAAESHVCRSIEGPRKFIEANTDGTFNLLEACRKLWNGARTKRFHLVSTDEVFGYLMPEDPPFDELTPIKPTSPYAASKAASDCFAMAYAHTYGMWITITNCSNNFGPNQHEEKLIPRAILRALKGEPMILFGSGDQIRDWIYVNDHCRAIDTVIHSGLPGQRYCVGGDCEIMNKEVARRVYEEVGVPFKCFHTNDRPTDDPRYAINSARLKALGWAPRVSFDAGLRMTVDYYRGTGTRPREAEASG